LIRKGLTRFPRERGEGEAAGAIRPLF